MPPELGNLPLESHHLRITRIIHEFGDEHNDWFDFEAGRTYVQLNFLISYLVATNPARPRWREESIFAGNGG